MLNYTPSQLTENKTLLEEFLHIRDYLEANPLYKVYYAGTNYVADVLNYAMNVVTLKEGEKLGVGDVVLFANAYYAKVEDVSEDVTTFTVSQGVNIRGPQGATGATGAQGPQGETGPAGNDGHSTFVAFVNETLSDGMLIDITPKANENMKVGDSVILLSQYVFQQQVYTQMAIGLVRAIISDTKVRVACSNVISTKGAQGPQGEAGNAMYIYNGLLDSSVVDVQVSQITIPTGRTLQAKDILISSYESSIGAMAQVVTIADGVATVNFIGQISTGGGGTTLNKYTTTLDVSVSSNRDTLYRILKNAKKISYIRNVYSAMPVSFALDTNNAAYVYLSWCFIDTTLGLNNCSFNYNFNSSFLDNNSSRIATTTTDGSTITVSKNFSNTSLNRFIVAYENDKEIT